MNMFRLISRSLVITVVALASVQVNGMDQRNIHIEKIYIIDRAAAVAFESRNALTLAATFAGLPNWGVAMVAAAGDSLKRSVYSTNVSWKDINKKAFAVNTVLYAGLNAAQRYGFELAGSYVGLPTFMTEKFAGFSSGVQAALTFFGSFFGQMLHDHGTRMGVSKLNKLYFAPKSEEGTS